MTHHWDEFSKSLAQPLPRRESLRRLGIALGGAVLSPLGLQTASAGHNPKQQTDPCKAFCKCRNKKQQNACLAACQACGNDPRFLCGNCTGGYACTDLASDPYNCGACGHVCNQAGPYEYAVCVSGDCDYFCVDGALRCNDTCTDVGWDPNNCGACGNVCGGPNASCYQGACSTCTPSCPEGWCGGDGCGGECACPNGMYCEQNGWCYADCPSGQTLCDGQCVDTMFDADNCGGCGQACPTGHVCSAGSCCNPTISDCFGSDPCVFPFILCGGVCVDPTSDRFNCGGCGAQCASDEACIFGFCVSG